MPGPLYIPVLPARPYAAEAYRRLCPDVQNAVSPVWNLPVRAGLSPCELATAFRQDVATVAKVQRHRSAWLDAPAVDEEQVPLLAQVLLRSDVGMPMRPVTGPGRLSTQQAMALELAVRSGDGMGIRVRVPGEWQGREAGEVRELVARTGPAVAVDLLLDLVAVLTDRPEAAKQALRALESLAPLACWRTVAILGGGVPRVTQDALEQGMCEVTRMEWRTWCEIAEGRGPRSPELSYGDYGVQPANDLTRAVPAGRGGPSWGALRYTTDDSYLAVKMAMRGEGRVAHNRAAARRLLQCPGFRGPAAGAAETWLRDCGCGQGPRGTGNFHTWLWVGNAQHMTYVARSLAA
ncbi:beta family protein [Streptomyces orinoci]|uniref:T4 beta protein n=1 Tax=Streptomyces orinoci TaxID=67339 RepID=A0ABV3K7U9_STRON|nr:hypothetical protein [Streptomyces orinoci]